MSRPETLTPPQADIFRGGYIESGLNVVLNLATGSGKTWLATRAAAAVAARGRRAIFLCPLKALAAELAADLSALIDAEVGVFTSDSKRNTRYSESRLLVMTPERLDLVTRDWRRHWSWLADVDLVVLDECHLLGDPSRGPTIEGAVSRFRRLNPFAQWLALSATLGNTSELSEWLDGIAFTSDWRATPLEWRVSTFTAAAQKPSLLCEHVGGCVAAGGQSLVFVHSRRRAEQLASFLSQAGLRSAFHHAGLKPAARTDVEECMRSGQSDVLVATSTLELGVNLPVRQVVLYDTDFFDGDRFVPMTCNAAWQRGGRAGRKGVDAAGEVVVLAPEWDRKARVLEFAKFESIQSRLDTHRTVAEQILVEVDARLATTDDQLHRVLSESLAGLQRRLPKIGDVVTDMVENGLLAKREAHRSSGHTYRTTFLGRLASRFLLSPPTALLLDRISQSEDRLTRFDLLVACCAASECSPKIPVDYEDLSELGEALSRQRSVLLVRELHLVRRFLAIDDWSLLCALNSAAVITEWTLTGDTETVAAVRGCYPNEVAESRDSVLRLLQPLAILMRRSNYGIRDGGDADVKVLMQMVRGGLDADAASLTMVEGIGPATARQLVTAGIGDIEALAQLEPIDLRLIPRVSQARAKVWIGRAQELAAKYSALHYRDIYGSHLVCVGPSTNRLPIDRYRLHRAGKLTVQSDAEGFIVTGGLDGHRVSMDGMICDCPDFMKGYRCKHVLAVALHSGDLAPDMNPGDVTSPTFVNEIRLEQLWSERFRTRSEN